MAEWEEESRRLVYSRDGEITVPVGDTETRPWRLVKSTTKPGDGEGARVIRFELQELLPTFYDPVENLPEEFPE